MTMTNCSEEEIDEEEIDEDDEGGFRSSTGRFRAHIDGHLRLEFFTGTVTLGLWLYPWFDSYIQAKWVGWYFYSKLRLGFAYWGVEYINHARSTYHTDRVRSVVLSREVQCLWNLRQKWKKWRRKDEA